MLQIFCVFMLFTMCPAGVLFDTTTRATIKPRLNSKLK